jgi:hypothetical protein
MRRLPGGLAECPGEMPSTHAGRRGQIGQSNVVRQSIFQQVQDPAQRSLGQWSDGLARSRTGSNAIPNQMLGQS